MDSSLSDIKFYMVRCVRLNRWVGKHSSSNAFMTDAYIERYLERGHDLLQYTTWWMKDPMHAKVWTDLREIRSMRKRARKVTGTGLIDVRKFASYEVVQFPEMIVIPLAEV